MKIKWNADGTATVNASELGTLDLVVALFTYELRAKLEHKLRQGYHGWDSEEFTPEKIKEALLEHFDKGDPIDVAAFALFWWNKTR